MRKSYNPSTYEYFSIVNDKLVEAKKKNTELIPARVSLDD